MYKLKYNDIRLKKHNPCNLTLGIEVELNKIEKEKNEQYLTKIEKENRMNFIKNCIEVYARKEE